MIGPAPSVGRPKSEKLGARVHNRILNARQREILAELTASPAWAQCRSDQRFALIMEAFDLSAKSKPDIVESPWTMASS